ncbi:MAG TPA: hypothetical protein VFF67_09385 [Thermoplasmata archaeon]|nr:hypothetical protein [Thermoplasmata archaeon]
MRALTDSEARVISALLADIPEGERDRLRRMGIPRSTYHAARRRAFGERWVADRYLPEPALFGRPWLTILVGRPFADRAGEFAAQLAAETSSVVVWTSPQLALAVGMSATPQGAQRLLGKDAGGRILSNSWSLIVDLRSEGVPVFFDFEGIWSHLAGIAYCAAYPRGLGASDSAERTHRDVRRHAWAARDLIRRPFSAEQDGRREHLIGTFGLPWSQRRLLETGAVRHRVFLDPARLPPFQGRVADQVVVVVGKWRSEQPLGGLFRTLTEECRVFPFLFAADRERVLLGALGRGTGGAAPASPEAAPRRSPMAVLRSWLEGIELVQESAAALTVNVDHRYDRLFPPADRRGRPASLLSRPPFGVSQS